MVNLLGGLVGQVIGLFGAKGKARQQAISNRISAMERSLTDEFIAVVWFSPMVVCWFSPERATAWIDAVTKNNPEYFAMLAAITAAVFGLGKINGRK